MSTRASSIAIALIAAGLVACGGQPAKSRAMLTSSASTDALMAMRFRTMVEEARAETLEQKGTKDPRQFVYSFEKNLRPRIQEVIGRELLPLPMDERQSADRMYDNWQSVLVRNDRMVFVGDALAAQARKETVSLSPGGLQCTGVIIAYNALATAQHCTENATFFRMGTKSKTGLTVKIDPSRFVVAKLPDGTALDLAVFVSPKRFPIAEKELPVFAPPEMIARAKDLTLVGFGGLYADSTGGGTKRQGIIPMLSPDCGGATDATDFQCAPGFEIVAGSRPLAEHVACPTGKEKDAEHGACHGDSGGPVFVESDDKLYLAGLIRAISPKECGCAKATNVYVRFDKQIDFLKNLPGIDFPPQAFAAIDAAAAQGGKP